MKKRNLHKKQRRKKIPKHTNLHHLVPRSRCWQFGIDPNDERNLIIVDKRKHSLYHSLVGNMVPREAFEFFCQTFWKGSILIKEE